MARQNIKNQEKKKLGVKFYSILATIISLVIIGLIIAGVVGYNKSTEGKYVNKFENWTKYKINYDEIDDIMDPSKNEFGRYTIIFAYDDNYIDSNEIEEMDNDDPNKSSYEKCNQSLNALYDTIMANNKKFSKDSDLYKRVDFYIINTSLIGNDTILSNSEYGNVGSAPSVIVLDHEGKNTTELSISDDAKYNITNGKGNYTSLTSDFKTLKDFINSIE